MPLALDELPELFNILKGDIPNFPSRLLSYMEKSMPVLACTDKNTDVGKIITENSFGWWCESNDAEKFTALVSEICLTDLKEYQINSYNYLINNYTVQQS